MYALISETTYTNLNANCRYPVLEGLYAPAWSQSMTPKEAVLHILESVPLKDWEQGHTKVFLKYYHPAELHKCSIALCDKIELLQNCT